jgi:thiazole synthase
MPNSFPRNGNRATWSLSENRLIKVDGIFLSAQIVAFVRLNALRSISRFPFDCAMSIEISDSQTSSAGSDSADAPLCVGTHRLASRLIVGTGKYANHELMARSLELSGTDCITVAVRRERLIDAEGRNLLDSIDTRRYTLLPNTAGCFTADDALRVARLGREILLGLENPGADWVKLEVLADKKTLLPDPIGTLEATERLVAEGFQVLCYSSDDPIVARRLKDAGATSVMPAGSPIGSGQGILNPNNIRICLEYLKDGDPDYPVIVDAGVGTASDVVLAMELGVDGVLLNTGIAHAADPCGMARAMRAAMTAGRLAWLSGRIPKKLYATASSPETGTISSRPR